MGFRARMLPWLDANPARLGADRGQVRVGEDRLYVVYPPGRGHAGLRPNVNRHGLQKRAKGASPRSPSGRGAGPSAAGPPHAPSADAGRDARDRRGRRSGGDRGQLQGGPQQSWYPDSVVGEGSEASGAKNLEPLGGGSGGALCGQQPQSNSRRQPAEPYTRQSGHQGALRNQPPELRAPLSEPSPRRGVQGGGSS